MVADAAVPVSAVVVGADEPVVAPVPPMLDVEREVVVVVVGLVVVVVRSVVDVVVERLVVDVVCGGVTVVCTWTGTRGVGVGRTMM